MKLITFCFTTCGEETSDDCLKAIEPWRDQVEVLEIRNVFPQIKALQQMVEGVQTELLVPLDADLILDEDAYERLLKAYRKFSNDPKWHTILFPLWDTLTEQRILALKLMRSKVLKQIPFNDTATPDIDHYKRLTDAGYTCVTRYLEKSTIGDHVVKGHHFCYHKYRDVYMTLRQNEWAWDENVFKGGSTIVERAKIHFDFFMYKLALTEKEDYLSCIAGMVDGLTAPQENKSKSLEKREYRISNEKAIDAFWKWRLYNPYLGGAIF
jgi:hypothetical protein